MSELLQKTAATINRWNEIKFVARLIRETEEARTYRIGTIEFSGHNGELVPGNVTDITLSREKFPKHFDNSMLAISFFFGHLTALREIEIDMADEFELEKIREIFDLLGTDSA